MKSKMIAAAMAAAFAAFAAGAHASVVFSDSFDANSLGLGYSSAFAPTGWTVTSGSIDLIGQDAQGNTSYDLVPGNGVYVDLDGTTSQGGTLGKTLTGLANGSYTVSYDLAGNHRGAPVDVVDVNVGGTSQSWQLASGDSFATHSVTVQVTDGTLAFSFFNHGGDNQGALLDNVRVSAVPEPASGALLLAGLGAVGLAARRRRG